MVMEREKQTAKMAEPAGAGVKPAPASEPTVPGLLEAPV